MTEANKMIFLLGMATVYGGPMDADIDYVGNPLYCDRGNDLVYDEQAEIPWVAFDRSEYASGRIKCGDRVRVLFADGQVLDALALDAGRLYDFYVAEQPDLPIVVDVPFMFAPFEGLSTVATVVNLSEARRQLERLIQP